MLFAFDNHFGFLSNLVLRQGQYSFLSDIELFILLLIINGFTCSCIWYLCGADKVTPLKKY